MMGRLYRMIHLVLLLVSVPALAMAVWITAIAGVITGPSPILMLAFLVSFQVACALGLAITLPLTALFGRFLKTRADAAVFGGCIAGMAACLMQVPGSAFESLSATFFANLAFAFLICGFVPGSLSGALAWSALRKD